MAALKRQIVVLQQVYKFCAKGVADTKQQDWVQSLMP